MKKKSNWSRNLEYRILEFNIKYTVDKGFQSKLMSVLPNKELEVKLKVFDALAYLVLRYHRKYSPHPVHQSHDPSLYIYEAKFRHFKIPYQYWLHKEVEWKIVLKDFVVYNNQLQGSLEFFNPT